jgi:hypothetical protein
MPAPDSPETLVTADQQQKPSSHFRTTRPEIQKVRSMSRKAERFARFEKSTPTVPSVPLRALEHAAMD